MKRCIQVSVQKKCTLEALQQQYTAAKAKKIARLTG
jgi:hypothetical protein